ncbi:MAG: serine hydrolase [Bacteroidota bacterium]|nr:serine hydrolase [Bacteroidota bacterium]
MRKFVSAILVWSFFCVANSIAQPAFIRDNLDSYIQQGIKDWNIPGLAIAIVKDGKVVVMKGYGVKDISTHEPVDENTLFMIASNSKLFTGTALAQLEYDKKLSLNDKITNYFPSYRLFDEHTTALVTIRDMLSHHLGTKTFQGDFTFWDGNLSRQQIMQKMRLLKPEGNFRQDFGYCNSCFLTAGEIIPQVTGKPWEVYVYDSIIAPLGMTNTHTLGRNMEEMPDAARPYTTSFSDHLQRIPYDHVDNLAPAGSIVSCVKDLSKWLIMQLDSGRYEGKKIIPWPVISRTREMNTIISSNKRGNTHFMGYGLGIFMMDYNGKQVFWHTGGAFGFVTNTCFVPEENLGITILTNQDNQAFFELLRYQILDAYLNQPYINRSKQALPAAQKQNKESFEQVQQWKARIKGNTPSLPLTAYTGTYKNELYGTISITAKDKGLLFIKFNGHNNLTASLQYMDNNEWMLSYNNAAFGIFSTSFTTENNTVHSISIKANDFVEFDPYTFIKQ